MSKFRCGILIGVAPVLVFIGGIIHIHPEAAVELKRFCRSSHQEIGDLVHNPKFNWVWP